jgi:uncharacterized protein (DUF302 family)
MNKIVSKISQSFLLGILLVSCNTSIDKFNSPEGKEIRQKVDQMVVVLDSSITKFNQVVRIDHSRFAEEVDVFTPPSIVTIFSNARVNSNLIKKNQLIGIDLPFKVLCYSEPDLKEASIAFTSPEFMMKRHGLNQDDMKEYASDILPVINSFSKKSLSKTDLSKVPQNFAIIKKTSDFDFETSLEKLKVAINSQGDTKMFGEINFKKEAQAFSIELEPTILILFGAPEPGGKAMHECPKLGLDAFCQKILIFEKDNVTYVAYNDIVEFSELYYQEWTIPQRIINYRLNNVFENAITEK